MNDKIVIRFFFAFVSIIILFYYYPLHYPAENKNTFGTYLDYESANKGYTLESCVINFIESSTNYNSTFHFGCRLKQQNPELPIKMLTTFPFDITEENYQPCMQGAIFNATLLDKNYSAGELLLSVGINSKEGFDKETHTLSGRLANEIICLKTPTSIDKDYILGSRFETNEELNADYQYILKGNNILKKISPSRFRFELIKTADELPIRIGYCEETLNLKNCVRLVMPNELIINLNIPRNKYELDFSSFYPSAPGITYKEEITSLKWNLRDNDIIRFEIVDKQTEIIGSYMSLIATFILGVLLSPLLGKLESFLLDKQ